MACDEHTEACAPFQHGYIQQPEEAKFIPEYGAVAVVMFPSRTMDPICGHWSSFPPPQKPYIPQISTAQRSRVFVADGEYLHL